MTDMLDIGAYGAADLFTVAAGAPRTNRATGERVPATFNLDFRYNGAAADALAGGGIYAIRYRTELLYIGIFTGDQHVPFAGNVARERLSKHLEALTMRGRRVGFSEANYDTSVALADGPLVQAIRSSRAQRGNGGVRSYPCKVEFAAGHWDAMSAIETDASVLRDFGFLYARIAPDHYPAGIGYGELKAYIAVIEDTLIRDARPRCNERHSTPRLENLRHGPPATAWDRLGHALTSGDWPAPAPQAAASSSISS